LGHRLGVAGAEFAEDEGGGRPGVGRLVRSEQPHDLLDGDVHDGPGRGGRAGRGPESFCEIDGPPETRRPARTGRSAEGAGWAGGYLLFSSMTIAPPAGTGWSGSAPGL